MNGEPDRLIRALGRVKREAEETPIVFTEQRQRKLQFFGWVIGSCVSVVVAIVIGTSVVVSYKNDVTLNKTDIAGLKAEMQAVKDSARDVRDEHNRQKPIIEKDHDLVQDLATQREYGVNNKEWYQRKYNMAAPTLFPAPGPQPDPVPAPR